nr:radical SAM family heme chaperone HemW [uncultured Merdimonas sp.]
MRPLELYLHIPFCVQKCKYCDFLSAPASLRERQDYVESLCQKIRSYRNLAKAYHVVSIFIGGGTPSLLSSRQMEGIVKALKSTFEMDPDVEFTVEANPGTLSLEKLQGYRRLGINRLSLGLQSTKEEELRCLGRIHSFGEFLESFRQARDAGFTNINVDLMSGIPGQTLESWEESLKTVAGLGPEHISAYGLIIEEGTPFYEMYGEHGSRKEGHEEDLPDEETDRRMYHRTKEILRGYGYERYEISNYARPGYECRHNRGYWERTEYLGIGAGAASLIDNQRWNEGEEKTSLSREDQMEEYMFLGLRKMEGVSKDKFRQLFGCEMEAVYGSVLESMYEKNLLESSGDFVRLTELGIDVSNYVMSEFLL